MGVSSVPGGSTPLMHGADTVFHQRQHRPLERQQKNTKWEVSHQLQQVVGGGGGVGGVILIRRRTFVQSHPADVSL